VTQKGQTHDPNALEPDNSKTAGDRDSVPKYHRLGYRMVTWPMSSHDPERSNLCSQYAWSAICRK